MCAILGIGFTAGATLADVPRQVEKNTKSIVDMGERQDYFESVQRQLVAAQERTLTAVKVGNCMQERIAEGRAYQTCPTDVLK